MRVVFWKRSGIRYHPSYGLVFRKGLGRDVVVKLCFPSYFGLLSSGAGAFEVAAAHHLRTVTKKLVQGRAKLGIEAFAEALMGFPKIIAENSGHDAQVWILCMIHGTVKSDALLSFQLCYVCVKLINHHHTGVHHQAPGGD